METETQAPSASTSAVPEGLEAIIKATVEKTIAGLLENNNFGRRCHGRGRSRSRSRSRGGCSRSRSGSRGRRHRSGSRGRRDRSGSRGRRDRCGSRGRRERSGSRERGPRFGPWEDYGAFAGPQGFFGPHRHHHFHHPPPWAFQGGEEWDFPGRDKCGKWAKFGRRFHKRWFHDEPNGQSNVNKDTCKEDVNEKEATPAPDRDLRNNFQKMGVDDIQDLD